MFLCGKGGEGRKGYLLRREEVMWRPKDRGREMIGWFGGFSGYGNFLHLWCRWLIFPFGARGDGGVAGRYTEGVRTV